MSRPTCALFLPKPTHRLHTESYKIVTDYFHVMINTSIMTDDEIADRKPDVVISFLSDRILRGKILELPNINFHPAPPKYPGRGGASYALFNGDRSYGATAHKMVEKVDAGEIYIVDHFPINSQWGCKELFEAAEDHSLQQLNEFCQIFSEGKMPAALSVEWSGKARTKKCFQDFLDYGAITADSLEEQDVKNLVRACKHPDFPGPYIWVGGYKFELSKNQ